MLISKRELYENNGIFPSNIIEFISKILKEEKDEDMNCYLSDLPADDRLLETRKIIHRSLHRH